MQRILLKLSGEALAGEAGFGIDPQILARLSGELGACQQAGAEIAVVLGGGNLFRGAALAEAGLDRVTGDHMGMLATCMNALAFQDSLKRHSIGVQAFSAIPMDGVLPGYSVHAAAATLERGDVAILAGGTGNPFFTTDTAACLRGIELKVDRVLKATKVDGVYSADPMVDPTATRFDTLTYQDVLTQNLTVMDLTAICLCRDSNMPLVVFDMFDATALTRIIRGEKVGTEIRAHGDMHA